MNLSNITLNTHSSIRIAGEKVIYFDPFEVKAEQHDADIIFVTHDHFDHFEPESVEKTAKEDTVIVAPASMEAALREKLGNISCVLCEPNTTHTVKGLTVEAVPAYNVGKDFHPKERKWLGYIVTMDGIRYYVAGDTDINEDIRKISCDVALVPAGGKYTMDKVQAAAFIAEIKPCAAIPTHYGTVAGTTADGRDFISLLEKADKTIQTELKL